MIDLELIQRNPEAIHSALLKRMDAVDLAPRCGCPRAPTPGER